MAMKRKTIESVLSRKFDKFLDSIESTGVRELVKKNSIITGGSIASMLLGEDVNDYDIYFTNKETVKAVAGYYVAKFKKLREEKGKPLGVDLKVVDEDELLKNAGRVKIVAQSSGIVADNSNAESNYRYFEQTDPESTDAYEYVNKALKIRKDAEESKGKYLPVFLTTNAISLSDDVQLITRFYGNANEIHKNYDFVHCTSYWDSATRKIVLRPEAMEALLSKTLQYQGSRYPLCSLFRIRKFLDRGWRINAGQILKIAMNLQDFDLENPAVLEDQLVGVDVAYFMELMEKLKEHNPDKVDKTYLVNLIDELF